MRTRSRRPQLSMSGPTMNRQVRHPDGCRITWLGSDVVVCKSGVPIVRRLALNLHNARVEGFRCVTTGATEFAGFAKTTLETCCTATLFTRNPCPASTVEARCVK